MIAIKQFIIILLLVFLIFLITFAVSAQKKILVLHSYHHGLEWTDQISEGINSLFPDKDKVKIFYEYLDAKRNYSKKYSDLLISLYREKSKIFNFDAIIVSDNAAFNFIIKYGPELYPETPIIFCGVNNLNKKLVANKNICGIVENAEHRATINLILRLHPDLNKLIIINDRTLTGKNVKEELKIVLKDYQNVFEYEIWDSFTIKELQNKLEKLNNKDVIYLLALNRDKHDNFITYHEGINKIKEVSNNPIYGAWDFYLGKGIVGGKLISAQNQGREAALLAKSILNDETPCTEKIIDNSGSRYHFDYQEMKKYNITKEELPAESIIINQPEAFWAKNYRYLLWLLMFLAAVIVILLIKIVLKYKEKLRIENLNKELEAKIEERTRELRRISITDELTDLFNRRHVLELLELELEKSKRYYRNLSIIMLDIDFFKRINDNYGHQVGDKVLQIISDILQENTRNIDSVGRYGGEEFLIILPETNVDKAYLTAEKLRKKIKNTEIKAIDSKITVSSGVVQFENESSNQLIKKADELLYRAKNNGRDRVEK